MPKIKFKDLGTIQSTGSTESDDSDEVYWSSYFVLLNSNKRVKFLNEADRLDRILKDTLVDTLSDENLTTLFREYRPETHTYKPLKSPEDILDIEIKAAAEIGSHKLGGRVHVHALVKVKHHKRLQMHYSKFIQLAKEKAKMPLFVHLKEVATQEAIEQYIMKGQVIRKSTYEDELSKMVSGLVIRNSKKNEDI